MGVIAHDLRAPLSAVALSAGSLLRQQGAPANWVRTLGRIAHAAERMGRMIGNLLDLVRSRQGGGLVIHPRPTELAAVAREIVGELEASHPGRQIAVSVDGDTHAELDEDRMAEVVSNLVGNALTYSPAGSAVQVDVRGQNGEVDLAVHNTGVPIPRRSLDTISAPFRRGTEPESGAPSMRGLGLGLYIVGEIARAHGGTIEVASTAEEGTTFPRCGSLAAGLRRSHAIESRQEGHEWSPTRTPDPLRAVHPRGDDRARVRQQGRLGVHHPAHPRGGGARAQRRPRELLEGPGRGRPGTGDRVRVGLPTHGRRLRARVEVCLRGGRRLPPGDRQGGVPCHRRCSIRAAAPRCSRLLRRAADLVGAPLPRVVLREARRHSQRRADRLPASLEQVGRAIRRFRRPDGQRRTRCSRPYGSAPVLPPAGVSRGGGTHPQPDARCRRSGPPCGRAHCAEPGGRGAGRPRRGRRHPDGRIRFPVAGVPRAAGGGHAEAPGGRGHVRRASGDRTKRFDPGPRHHDRRPRRRRGSRERSKPHRCPSCHRYPIAARRADVRRRTRRRSPHVLFGHASLHD